MGKGSFEGVAKGWKVERIEIEDGKNATKSDKKLIILKGSKRPSVDTD